MPTSTALPPIAQVFSEDTRDQATTAVHEALHAAKRLSGFADAHGHFRVHFGKIVITYPGYPAPDAEAQFVNTVCQLAPEFGLTMIGGSEAIGYAFKITT